MLSLEPLNLIEITNMIPDSELAIQQEVECKILNISGHDSIHYVGHSMGTTAFMVTMNERPEYADKIIMANLLAPMAYVEHMTSPISLLAPYVDDVEVILLSK